MNKLTSEAPTGSERHPILYLTPREIDNLQWAKDFLDNYEKKHGSRI